MSLNFGSSAGGGFGLFSMAAIWAVVAAIIGAILAALILFVATQQLSPAANQNNAPKFVYGSGTPAS